MRSASPQRGLVLATIETLVVSAGVSRIQDARDGWRGIRHPLDRVTWAMVGRTAMYA